MDVSSDASDPKIEASVITKELLEMIMQQKENTENILVKSFTVSPGCEKGANYVSIALSVKLALEINERETTEYLFFKLPHSKGVVRDWIENWINVFAKEAHTYMDVIPAMVQLQIEKGVEPIRPSYPIHYYSKAEGLDGFVALENLRPGGYVLQDKVLGLDETHCRLVLKELALFHALSFGLKNRNPGKLKQFDTALQEGLLIKPFIDVFEQPLKASLTLVRMVTKEQRILDAVQKLESWNMLDVLKEHVKPVEPYTVICHGDISRTNILFKYNVVNGSEIPVDVKLFDLQFTRCALPTTDLAHFFYTSTTRTMRKKSLKNLLAFYHFHFTECLKRLDIDFPEFSLAVLEELFKRNALFGIILSCCFGFSILRRSGIPIDFSQNQSEVDKRMSGMAKELLAKEENRYIVREKIVGCFEDAVEMGIM